MKDDFLFILFLLFIISTVFYVSFFNNFKGDDFTILYVAKLSSYDISNIFTTDLGGYFRPFNRLSTVLWYELFGLNPVLYNLLNIFFFHFVSSILVFFIACRFMDKKFARISCLLFAVLAVHFDSVLFSSSGYADSTLFGLLSLASIFTFIKWNETKGKKYLFMSIMFFVFDLLSYEASVVLPLLFFVYLFVKSNLKNFFLNVRKILIYGVFMLPYLIYQFLLQRNEQVIGSGMYIFGWHVVKNFFDYIVSFFMLIPMIDASYLSRINAPIFMYNIIPIFVFLCYFAVVFAIFYIFKGSKNMKFFFIWFIITILPFLFFTSPIQSRYMYLPSVGICVLIGLLFERLSSYNSKIKTIAYSLLFLFLIFNIVGLILIERYKFNNGTSDESVMINFMKTKYPTFPENSKIYFVRDDMPFHDFVLGMILNLYYPQGKIIPHNLTLDFGNNYSKRFVVYYSEDLNVYEIYKKDVYFFDRDNLTFIFDFIKTDYRPGTGIELT